MGNKYEQTAPLSQFRGSQNQVSWRHQKVPISGYSLKTIHFMDTSPNQFMIQNPTGATLYIGISTIPTANNYEFKVAPNSSKTFGRPIPTDELYILNISNADISINLFSVLDRFDLSLMTDTNVSLDLSIVEAIKGDGMINGFANGVSLPAGTKHIGEVSIDSATTVLLTSIVSNFGSLLRKNTVANSVNLYDINDTLQALAASISGGTAIESTLSKEQTGSHNMSFTGDGQNMKIFYFTNDSANDIILTWKEVGSTTDRTLTVKSGETVNDIEFAKLGYFTITCIEETDAWRFCYAKLRG